MGILEAVIAALKNDAAVAAIVADRVFLAGARQGTEYPYVTVQRLAGRSHPELDAPSSLEAPLLQIDWWDPVAATADAGAQAGRRAIDCIEITIDDLTFTAVFVTERGPEADEKTRNFRVSQDFHAWHERA